MLECQIGNTELEFDYLSSQSYIVKMAMKKIGMVFIVLVLGSSLLRAQSSSPNADSTKPMEDYSGMYSFLKEGEFVQLTMEGARVDGFVSRYGELESDQGVFLNQFFKEAKLKGKEFSFITQTVHGVWYEFKGAIERGSGKNVGDEAYYELKGKLIQHTIGPEGKASATSREVVFKAFPQNLRDEETQ